MGVKSLGRLLLDPGLKLVRIFSTESVVGALCVVIHEGQVVFVRHTYGNRRLWQLPGGRLKKGESPEEAILRELDEELDITPKRLEPLGEKVITIGRRVTTLHLFRGWLGDQVIDIDGVEIAEYRWFPEKRSPNGVGPGARAAMQRHRALERNRTTP